MTSNRIMEHPVLGKLENQTPINFTFDGQTYTGFESDTIASALLANGIRKLRVHESTGAPRAIYCNIGHCFECRVTVDNKPNTRACMTTIQDQMVIESGTIQPSPFKSKEQDWPRTYADFEKANEDRKDGDSDV